MRALMQWLLVVAAWLACAAHGEAVRVLQREAKRVFYLGVVAPPSAFEVVAEFNRSVLEASRTLFVRTSRNVTLQPLYIELPEDGRFRASLLETTCSILSGKRVSSLLVLESNDAASAVSITASYAGVAVVRRAKLHSGAAHAILADKLPMEIRLEITPRETLYAIRALLLHTHWHTFTLLAQEEVSSGLSLQNDLYSIISTPPLMPTFVTLPSQLTKHTLFRRLADLSRSTRGVVVLICDLNSTRYVMNEAKRLNMLDGHFVWLWIDVTDKVDVFSYAVSNNKTDNIDEKNSSLKNRDKRKKEPSTESSLKRLNFDLDRHKVKNDNFNSSESYVSREKYQSDHYLGKFKLRKEKADFNHRRKLKVDINEYRRLVERNIPPLSGSSQGALNFEEMLNVNNLDLIMNPMVQEFPTIDMRSKIRKKRLSQFSFSRYNTIDLYNKTSDIKTMMDSLPVGLLALKPVSVVTNSLTVRSVVMFLVDALSHVYSSCDDWAAQAQFYHNAVASCWEEPIDAVIDFSAELVRELRLRAEVVLAGFGQQESILKARFQILNLIRDNNDESKSWQTSGTIEGRVVDLNTIVWPGGDIVVSGLSTRARSVFRIVTAPAPPFVMEGELDEDGQCLRGVPCHRLHTADKDNLTLAFNDLETYERLEEDNELEKYKIYQGSFFPTLNIHESINDAFFAQRHKKAKTHCCYGMAMDLLENIAMELEFDFHLYIVSDGFYGTRKFPKKFEKLEIIRNIVKKFGNKRDYRDEFRNGFNFESINEDEFEEEAEIDPNDDKWNGIVGDLMSGAAHMSFAALSVSRARSEVIDFSQPYFFSGVSFLAAPKQKSEVPLLAFLLPFSPELWIAIFTSLNVTAIAVAIYEWLSPFGLNPWGRQRSKNFSISSALWVMWGLLCGHLVAFKAPKSWPNKFLINVWGGFSVIFVASYTANIAALIAGLFFQNAVDDYNDRSLLSQRVGIAKASVAEYYIQRTNPHLWQHIRQFSLQNLEEGIKKLRNGTIDLLISDTPILDYYRATDHGCKLQKIGESINEDTYAIGMSKGFPLKHSINTLISKYLSNGYMDILQEKWYGGLPCFKLGKDYVQPRPLGVAAVAGVFLLLGLGVLVGILILILEHLFYKYTLPLLRHQPKGTIWRSRNIMFFSQKLYRFINCVELVSPHHAARELVHTIKQGQITSLFQKSVKRKEHEQRRRRKSKAQFFEMIQEIRRVQQEERDLCNAAKKPMRLDASPRSLQHPQTSPQKSRSRSPVSGRIFGLNIRRFSTDGSLDSGSLVKRNALNVGRRLSKGTTSPPDIKSRKSSNNDNGRLLKCSSSPREFSPDTRAALSWQDVSEQYEDLPERTLRRCRSRGDGNSTEDNDFSGIEIRVEDTMLPPAPPYPKVSPRSGRSPLSRLTQEELIDLWRSSESELRNHLLAAINEKKSIEPG